MSASLQDRAFRPKVVIVGGGFGGLACAKALGGADIDVTVVDRRNHNLFQPSRRTQPFESELIPPRSEGVGLGDPG